MRGLPCLGRAQTCGDGGVLVSGLQTPCPSASAGSVGESQPPPGLAETPGLGFSSPEGALRPPRGPRLWLAKAAEGREGCPGECLSQGPDWLVSVTLCQQVCYFGLCPWAVFGNTRMMEKFGGKRDSLQNAITEIECFPLKKKKRQLNLRVTKFLGCPTGVTALKVRTEHLHAVLGPNRWAQSAVLSCCAWPPLRTAGDPRVGAQFCSMGSAATV